MGNDFYSHPKLLSDRGLSKILKIKEINYNICFIRIYILSVALYSCET